ncbi:hypothetical protein ACJMK2_043728 [Sinanodonta woodiana]|uniref:Mediator of RNA polymerase II transcription subunit 27 n=1 Tax=Sinanodonta woodiana TaxID=1069815 RepID=A0ABD3VYC8_SINWO
MADNQTDALIEAINFTQKLRASVTKVFDNLADGFQDSQGNEKALLNEFQKSLLAVNNDFNELEKVGNSLYPLSINSPNSIHLSIDPATDKTPLYSQLIQSYKWSNKAHELAGYVIGPLDQNAKLKRSMLIGSTLQAKKLRRVPPSGHAATTAYVDNIVMRLDQKMPDISISISRPLGSSAILQVSLGKILKAVVALRGLIIEWVTVKGYQEDLYSEDGKVDLWSQSRYQVFQKVNDSATAATLHFYSPHNAELALQSFLHWFQSYKTLFSAPCIKCGKHYLQGSPPTWRDLRNTEPYHDVCKP